MSVRDCRGSFNWNKVSFVVSESSKTISGQEIQNSDLALQCKGNGIIGGKYSILKCY